MDNVTFSTLTSEKIIGIVNPSIPHIDSLPVIAGEFSPMEHEIKVDKENTLWILFNGMTEIKLCSKTPFYLCVACNGDRFNVLIPPNHKVVMVELETELISQLSRTFTHKVSVCPID